MLNFGLLIGGWQDGATAVCVWVLGQTVSFAIIYFRDLPILVI